MTNNSIIDTKELNANFEFLHSHGEIGFHEYKTTKFLTKKMDEYHIKYQQFKGFTGLVATIGNGKPIVAIRADIDALKQVYNGKVSIFHSCGHDAHMSIVLAVAKYFSDHPDMIPGTLKFVFQPAEETGEGAKAVIKSKTLGHIDYFFGLHLRPQNEVEFKHAEPIIPHGACRTLSGKIIGKTAHAGMPELGKNVIDYFTDINQTIRKIRLPYEKTYSAKATIFKAGDSSNIIPGEAIFSFDLRAQDNLLMEKLHKKVLQVLTNSNIDIKITDDSFSPAAIPSASAISIMKKAITNILGEQGLDKPVISAGGDDFHFYAYKNKQLQTTMLGLGCDLTPGLHVPEMKFNHESMVDGALILIKSIELTNNM